MKFRILTSTILTAVAAMTAPGVCAEEPLSKEITVDHDVVPLKRKAAMPPLEPAVRLPAVAPAPLAVTTDPVTVKVPSTDVTVDPARAAGWTLGTPYRGYVAAGYLPLCNAAVAAGYRIVDTRSTTLSAWLQADFDSYRTSRLNLPEAGKSTLTRGDILVGAAMSHTLSSTMRLDASLIYDFNRFNQPMWQGADLPALRWRSVNRLNADVALANNGRESGFHAALSYGLFANSAPLAEAIGNLTKADLRAATENRFSIDGGIWRATSSESRIGMDARLDMVSTSKGSGVEPYTVGGEPFYMVPVEGSGKRYTHGLLTLTPAYTLASGGNLSLRVGARVQLTFNSGKAFHIAPDVDFGWRIFPQLGLRLRAGGGEWQNTLSRLYSVNPYANPYVSYRNSHIPLTADAAITVGPFKGIALEVAGAYAAVNDRMMPVANGYSATLFRGVDMRGWRFRAAASYTNGRWGRAEISYEATPKRSYDRGWWEWTDRARSVLAVRLTATPLKPLRIDLGWQLRSGRRLLDTLIEINDVTDMQLGSRSIDLADMSCLDLGASWRFTPQLSVGLRLENLLADHWLSEGLIPSQGIHGLASVAYQF